MHRALRMAFSARARVWSRRAFASGMLPNMELLCPGGGEDTPPSDAAHGKGHIENADKSQGRTKAARPEFIP